MPPRSASIGSEVMLTNVYSDTDPAWRDASALSIEKIQSTRSWSLPIAVTLDSAVELCARLGVGR